MNSSTNTNIEPHGGRALVPAVAIALSAEDEAALRRAVGELRRSSLAMRLTSLIGRQIGVVGMVVPAPVAQIVTTSAETAIRSAMGVALRSLSSSSARDRRVMHRSIATIAGAAGGALGLAGLPIELPFTTIVMLRSIADIAQSEGEDLSDPAVGLACLEVFALGGDGGEALETGYFALRVLLARTVTDSARHLLERGLSEQAAPLLVRLIAQISARFGVVVSQKLAAQSVPIIGAASGATINYAFVDHFQSLARGHFTIRRLERVYGAAVVQAEYARMSA